MIKPIILSGPSGGGKSTILAKAMNDYPGFFAFCVSHTTRKPRNSELNGEHYYFVDRATMERMIEQGEFLEFTQFGGNLYGTSKKTVANICGTDRICVLDVELQGVHNLKKANFDAKYIFIRPPSMEVLENRLRQRGTETVESIAKRLKHAKEDLATVEKEPTLFDVVVVNEELEKAYADFLDAIRPELKAVKQRRKMLYESELVKSLRNENVLKRLALANKHSAKNLKTFAIKYIQMNAKEVMGSDEWKMLIEGFGDVHSEADSVSEIVTAVFGAVAFSFILYLGYNRIKKSTW